MIKGMKQKSGGITVYMRNGCAASMVRNDRLCSNRADRVSDPSAAVGSELP